VDKKRKLELVAKEVGIGESRWENGQLPVVLLSQEPLLVTTAHKGSTQGSTRSLAAVEEVVGTFWKTY
jgi:hypothetical protein